MSVSSEVKHTSDDSRMTPAELEAIEKAGNAIGDAFNVLHLATLRQETGAKLAATVETSRRLLQEALATLAEGTR